MRKWLMSRLSQHAPTASSAHRPTMNFSMLELPPELRLCIFEQLDPHADKDTLRAAARACRLLQDLAEPFLYKHIFLRTGLEVATLLKSVAARPARVKLIHTLDVRCQWGKSSGIERLEALLRTAANIDTLTIESPYCNSGRWHSTGGAWEPLKRALLEPIAAASLPNAHPDGQPLQNLTTLTLHLNGERSEFWYMMDYQADIFGHPTLRDLTMSCAAIPSLSKRHLSKYTKSPLKRLTLDQCQISLIGLAALLAIPAALEYLYLGEYTLDNDEQQWPQGEEYDTLCHRSANAFILALGQQANSLTTLTYYERFSSSLYGGRQQLGSGLNVLHQLKELRLLGDTDAQLQTMLMSDLTSPPVLRALHLQEHSLLEWIALEVDDEGNFLQLAESSSLPGPIADLLSANSELKVLQFRVPQLYETTRARWSGVSQAIASLGEMLRERGIDFRVHLCPRQPRFVRPILYGEVEDVDELLYSNCGEAYIPLCGHSDGGQLIESDNSEYEDGAGFDGDWSETALEQSSDDEE
ncbi:hypothetical protein BAUCODRAFT_21335 [Baudoinia panamericana UAMH 10762]|uniref:F-box domain-containing protein n=1 Tax=Baudoinia panamericana (strain UAMH 10762) TaxID=717646 RepID=M2NKC1_BAUPA|nr:uncharacterized protein BAUCODRAFT_21335 [Baudoinia panamericana UAMH 10762]EMC99555.1 hypothetical protein BAUCODRAFT_21335 [Baudoinia panamericana UAMH 10762]